MRALNRSGIKLAFRCSTHITSSDLRLNLIRQILLALFMVGKTQALKYFIICAKSRSQPLGEFQNLKGSYSTKDWALSTVQYFVPICVSYPHPLQALRRTHVFMYSLVMWTFVTLPQLLQIRFPTQSINSKHKTNIKKSSPKPSL